VADVVAAPEGCVVGIITVVVTWTVVTCVTVVVTDPVVVVSGTSDAQPTIDSTMERHSAKANSRIAAGER
jgi:hypothetical protein